MNKYLAMLAALVVALFTVDAMAYTPPPAPANGWYVVDQAGKMTESQMVQLNQKIDRISKATKNEFGVLLLQDMGGDNIEDVANATYKAWGVGKKGLDNGCLIVVAIKERKSRIETGKGVEGEVTDLQAQDILKKNLNPHLKSGDFYGGFDATLDSLSGLMESRIAEKVQPQTPITQTTPVADAPVTNNSSNSSAGLVILVLVLGGGGLAFALILLAANAKEKREEAERAFREEMDEERRERAERDRQVARQRKLELDQEDRERSLRTPTPNVDVPNIPSRGTIYNDPPKPTSYVKPTVVATVASIAAAEEARHLARKREEKREAELQRREEDNRRRRERDEEDRRRRDDDSSSSSSSGFDWGGSSSGSDSGGGFGGGDSGGGGSSSDW